MKRWTLLEKNAMKTEIIEIVDRGRGPQLSTTRITVLDVFYYLHRGYAFNVIHEIMPTLSPRPSEQRFLLAGHFPDTNTAAVEAFSTC